MKRHFLLWITILVFFSMLPAACVQQPASKDVQPVAQGAQPAAQDARKDVQPVAADAAGEVYLFSSFRGNGEDGLHLAWSEDGLKWTALKNDQSFLQPQVGKEKLMRDPCITQGPDGTFHMVWTDSWTDRSIGYASSKDLITWSEQRALPVMEHEPTARNCWAPEIVYDEKKQHFLIFWATTIPGRFSETDNSGDNNHRIYSTTTKDFKTFTPTKLFYDGGFNVIDATILRANNQFYLFVKDETRQPVAKKHLRVASGPTIEGPFTNLSEPFTPSWVEGPTAVQIGAETIVYYDEYTRHRYGAMRSRDLKTWEDISSQISFPGGSRHGTVFKASRAVLQKLKAAELLPPGGMVGVGTWSTQAEFKDIKVTKAGQTLYASDFSKGLQGWKTMRGKWEVAGGVLRQTGNEGNVIAVVGDPKWTDYTLSLKVRKLSGGEGFLILFQSPGDGTKSWWNLGGWGNTQHALESPGLPGTRIPGTIETGRWYDIKIELQGRTVKGYLDGKLVQEATRGATPG